MKHKTWYTLLVIVCGCFSALQLYGAHGADADVAVAAKISGVKATRAEQKAARLAAANAAIDASGARATVVRRGVGTTARVEQPTAQQGVVFSGAGASAAAAAAADPGGYIGFSVHHVTSPAVPQGEDASGHSGSAPAVIASTAQGILPPPTDGLEDVPEADEVGDDEDQVARVSAGFAATSSVAAAADAQPEETALTREQTAGLQALHQALTAQGFENIAPALQPVFDVTRLDQFVTKLLAAKRFTDADLRQLKNIFNVGSSVNIAGRLAGVQVTPELQEQLTSFLDTLQPLLKLALPEDSATATAMHTIVKSMKGADHTNLASMSLTSVLDSLSGAVRSSGAKLQQQTSGRNMKIFIGLLASNLAIIMFTIFGTSDMKKIGSGLLIAEAVMLSVLLLGRGAHGAATGGVPFNIGGGQAAQ